MKLLKFNLDKKEYNAYIFIDLNTKDIDAYLSLKMNAKKCIYCVRFSYFSKK